MKQIQALTNWGPPKRGGGPAVKTLGDFSRKSGGVIETDGFIRLSANPTAGGATFLGFKDSL